MPLVIHHGFLNLFRDLQHCQLRMLWLNGHRRTLIATCFNNWQLGNWEQNVSALDLPYARHEFHAIPQDNQDYGWNSETMASGSFGPGPINCLNCSLHRCVQFHSHKMAMRPRPAPLIGIPQMMNLVDLGWRPHNTLFTFILNLDGIICCGSFWPVQDKRNDDNDGHIFSNAWDDIAHAPVRVEIV